jgi:hypothetical protein
MTMTMTILTTLASTWTWALAGPAVYVDDSGS